MMTNVIASLYTTWAYQSAALHLMVAQANFDAQQLHLREALPITVPANTNDWRLGMPPEGVTGWFQTPRFIYRFNTGQLISIQKRPAEPGTPADPAETQPSLIDTNGAFQLARNALVGLALNVTDLDTKAAHTVTVHNAPGRPSGSPIYTVSWGGAHSHGESHANHVRPQASLEILGSTKQCVGMRIMNTGLFRTPPLQVTNADALLSPVPPPQHFVEEFLGGATAYNTVAHPDKVYAWLLTSNGGDPNAANADRTQAVAADAPTTALLSRTLTDFNSYAWQNSKGGIPDYGVRLQFHKGAEVVNVRICYQCDQLEVSFHDYSAELDCDAAHSMLMQAIQAMFPGDALIRRYALVPAH